jgi:CHAT domain-containing protein
MEHETSQSQSVNQQTPTLTIENKTYDLLSAPDAVKLLVDDMTRIAREVNELQFRLRQSQLTQQAYILAIEKELQDNNVQPISIAESTDQG